MEEQNVTVTVKSGEREEMKDASGQWPEAGIEWREARNKNNIKLFDRGAQRLRTDQWSHVVHFPYGIED